MLLDEIDSPADLKAIDYLQLKQLAEEIRQRLIETVSENGGHLASNLGTVELSIALHRTFNSPTDKLIWDVGHQSYTHKLLTGRRTRFDTIRQHKGLSGFTDPEESSHDPFGSGHAGNSISAALGLALARDFAGDTHHVVAIVGDGALTTGMVFEALNHAGQLATRLIIVLNDNGMSIYPSTGSIARLLNAVRSDQRYQSAKHEAKRVISMAPMGDLAWTVGKQFKNGIKRAFLPGALWEQMGFFYSGPIDGHNIAELEAALDNAKECTGKPIILHVLTQKGKGYLPAEENAVKFHGVSRKKTQPDASPISYSEVFGDTVCRLMREDSRVVAISAAMLDGTGLTKAATEFPDRVLDVGICEQHAVTLAAGLAAGGYIPIVAIYSTFLQRAYDQIIHDVCLQNLPVVFAIDRAGIVGDDGKTHQGAFDLSYLQSIPNMTIAAASNGAELQHLLFTATQSRCPMAIRYPREIVRDAAPVHEFESIPIGRAEVLREGDDITMLALGATVHSAVDAAEHLAKEGIDCSVLNARYLKPLDEQLITEYALRTKRLLTIEENVLAGGFGSAVVQLVTKSSLLTQIQFDSIGLPDEFIDHGPRRLFISRLGLDSDGIIRQAGDFFSEMPLSLAMEPGEPQV